MTVDEYLDGAPEPQKSTLNELRQSLREILPAAAEVMSYGVRGGNGPAVTTTDSPDASR
jgi:uncharacterized protein YdhG (YjbR/CyaY superfamily)